MATAQREWRDAARYATNGDDQRLLHVIAGGTPPGDTRLIQMAYAEAVERGGEVRHWAETMYTQRVESGEVPALSDDRLERLRHIARKVGTDLEPMAAPKSGCFNMGLLLSLLLLFYLLSLLVSASSPSLSVFSLHPIPTLLFVVLSIPYLLFALRHKKTVLRLYEVATKRGGVYVFDRWSSPADFPFLDD